MSDKPDIQDRMDIHVQALYYSSIKSCRWIALPEARVVESGIAYDREWMVVDERGMFCAQRAYTSLVGVAVKRLCLISVSLDSENLTLNASGMDGLKVPLANKHDERDRFEVQIGRVKVMAASEGREASKWLTQFLSSERLGEYRLVRLILDARRMMTDNQAQIRLHDSSPFLIISQASLDDLNSRMAEPLPMDRFRPNIVLSGCPPYFEDTLERIQIGDVQIKGRKLCVRCPITMINQDTAVIGKEPLRTLAKYRLTPKGITFGKYFFHLNTDKISVGDKVEVL